MEVDLPADIESRLVLLARERGTDAQALARTAIENLVEYYARFVRQVDKGLAQTEEGRVLTHEAVRLRIEYYLSERQIAGAR